MTVFIVMKHRPWPFGVERQWMKPGDIVGVFQKYADAVAAKKKDTEYTMYSIVRKVLK